jgi:signal transduction histidine kinase
LSDERLTLLAHELRSPVAALTALAERARETPLPPGVAARMLALAVAAGRDVERLLTDRDLFSIRPVELDLGELLTGLVQPRVAVAASSTHVRADPTRLRQLLGNLIANGLRHGEHVTLNTRVGATAVEIDVEDDGPGVDPLVDPFAKGESGSGSSGYGLWLARAIAEAHGGRLELTSSAGQPARFTLALPRVGERG